MVKVLREVGMDHGLALGSIIHAHKNGVVSLKIG